MFMFHDVPCQFYGADSYSSLQFNRLRFSWQLFRTYALYTCCFYLIGPPAEGAWDPCIDGLQQFHGVLQEKAMLESWGDQSCAPLLLLYTDDNHMIDICPTKKPASPELNMFSWLAILWNMFWNLEWVQDNLAHVGLLEETLQPDETTGGFEEEEGSKNHAKSRNPRKSFFICFWKSYVIHGKWLCRNFYVECRPCHDYLVFDRFEPPRWCAPLCPGGREGSLKRDVRVFVVWMAMTRRPRKVRSVWRWIVCNVTLKRAPNWKHWKWGGTGAPDRCYQCSAGPRRAYFESLAGACGQKGKKKSPIKHKW